MPPPSSRPLLPSGPTPLWAVLAFTFLNSIGSAIIYQGIFFIAREGYGFGPAERFGLGLVYGLTYIPGAILIGPLLRRLERAGSLSPRAVLASVMFLMAALCWLPSLAQILSAAPPAAAVDPAAADLPVRVGGGWSIWLLIALYSPLSGAMWPMVEAFLAGGRSDHQLRSATGKFNVTWAGALVISLPVIGPIIEKDALLSMQGLSAVHILAGLILLRTFNARPGTHAHHEHTPHPPVYTELLTFLRILLPTAFLFISTLSPYLPGALGGLGIKTDLATTIASTWLLTRVLTFLAMERWHGWHGRWSTVLWGGGILLVSFTLTVLAPLLLPREAALATVIAALAALGIGIGIIYCAALYYAMEVGAAEVDAGGIHETLIGVGYSVGPACGLAAIAIAESRLTPAMAYEPIMALLVCLFALAAAGAGLRFARRVAAPGNP